MVKHDAIGEVTEKISNFMEDLEKEIQKSDKRKDVKTSKALGNLMMQCFLCTMHINEEKIANDDELYGRVYKKLDEAYKQIMKNYEGKEA